MRTTSVALGMLVGSMTPALADFRMPDCDGLRKFPIGVLMNRIERDEDDQTLFETFGIDLFQLTSGHIKRIKEATVACGPEPSMSDAHLDSLWGEVLDEANEIRADIELEIEGDREEWLAAEARESEAVDASPPPSPPTSRTLSLEEDQRAAENLLPYVLAYQIGNHCADNDVLFTQQDVQTMDATIRSFIDQTGISNAQVERIWSVSITVFSGMRPQLTVKDCVETRQQATYMFRFPATSTPNPFAR